MDRGPSLLTKLTSLDTLFRFVRYVGIGVAAAACCVMAGFASLALISPVRTDKSEFGMYAMYGAGVAVAAFAFARLVRLLHEMRFPGVRTKRLAREEERANAPSRLAPGPDLAPIGRLVVLALIVFVAWVLISALRWGWNNPLF